MLVSVFQASDIFILETLELVPAAHDILVVIEDRINVIKAFIAFDLARLCIVLVVDDAKDLLGCLKSGV